MARLSLPPWRNRLARFPPSGRRQTDPRSRLRTHPHLQVVEDRCLPSTGLIVASFSSGQVLRYVATTGAFLGTFATGLPHDHPISLTLGPDGDLYVGINNFDDNGQQTSAIRRFDGQTGTLLGTFASGGGLVGPEGLAFGPDGNLYVASFGYFAQSKVVRYDGHTGDYLSDFIPEGSGGLSGATSLVFGPDGNLYVTSRLTDQVLRYNGTTGAFLGVFATGGNNGPQDLAFGPDGNLYVLDDGNRQVLRFNGVTGQFLNVFASGDFGTDGIKLVFGPDRNLYVTSGFRGNSVLRFNGVTGQFLDTFVASGSGGLSYATGLLFFPSPAEVTCSVAEPLLWPPNHRLVNVGLSVTVDPPDANLHLLVYAGDNASPADAADLGPGTLQVRSERQGNGAGRVYLIVTTATNSGGTSFDVCAVAVPHDHSPRSIASVQQQAAAAEAYYRESQTAPPGYQLLGEGPEDGGGVLSSGHSRRNTLPSDIFRLNLPAPVTPPVPLDQEPLSDMADAAVPAEQVRSVWTSLAMDGYFAAAHEEGFRPTLPHFDPAWWDNGNGPGFDLVKDDQLVAWAASCGEQG